MMKVRNIFKHFFEIVWDCTKHKWIFSDKKTIHKWIVQNKNSNGNISYLLWTIHKYNRKTFTIIILPKIIWVPAYIPTFTLNFSGNSYWFSVIYLIENGMVKWYIWTEQKELPNVIWGKGKETHHLAIN